MAKKTFKENLNPAMQFITETGSDAFNEIPEGYKPNPKFIETKSKRVQLLVQPSVVEKVKSLARERNTSMNEIINQAIKDYIEDNKRG